ncbi:DUF2530 domain-containing protein [Streptomyces alkaliterrae]|uniref:DUF2530 domain-containing protein n=1 Tax=Streptomyces alkaliterrae TaxID=2213162 RepID=A0A5P0YNZ1_9ACTN|nr:DUF2530 domain-containing protein [Streptomyces alkaliterrae]MQS01991.1 DUF2530 domain-containing protein [Streptomyces alkaliterrae]
MSNWTDGKREAPEPLEGNVVATVIGGTIVWFALFLLQLPFYGWYQERGHDWWIWTCLAGGGLGLIGIWYVRARDAAIRRPAEQSPVEQSPAGEAPAGEAPNPAGPADAPGPADAGKRPAADPLTVDDMTQRVDDDAGEERPGPGEGRAH